MLAGCSKNESVVEQGVKKPNIVLIYTDDQRWDTLWAMKNVNRHLVKHGTTFTNAFTTIPSCCPTRASMLAGGFHPKSTHVLQNREPNGSVTSFTEKDSIAVQLQKEGYKTAMLGKYLNGYQYYEEPELYVPPGWSKWFSFTYIPQNLRTYIIATGSSGYLKQEKATARIFSRHQTGLLEEEAVEFIRDSTDSPFFLFVSTTLPHKPANPAPGDENLFPDFLPNAPSIDEADLSDKPQWLISSVKKMGEIRSYGARLAKKQLQSLQAIDRLVGSVMSELHANNLLENTIIVFTSDSGLPWGEHGIAGKAKPYEEIIRVPLIIRSPFHKGENNESSTVAANLDLGTTILRWAEIDAATNGYDLQPFIDRNPEYNPWKNGFLIQSFLSDIISDYSAPPWTAWRNDQYKLVEWVTTGEQEFYDLRNDPYEMESQHNNPAFSDIIEEFQQRIEKEAGFIISSPPTLKYATVDIPYSENIHTRYGTPPFKWSIYEGNLPNGLLLSKSDGLISGIPTEAGEYSFSIQVQDNSTSPYDGKPQAYVMHFTLTVDPQEESLLQ